MSKSVRKTSNSSLFQATQKMIMDTQPILFYPKQQLQATMASTVNHTQDYLGVGWGSGIHRGARGIPYTLIQIEDRLELVSLCTCVMLSVTPTSLTSHFPNNTACAGNGTSKV